MDATYLQVNGVFSRLCPPEAAVVAIDRWVRRLAAVVLVSAGMAGPLQAQENALGTSVQSLLDYARAQSPELAAMRQEADAAAQRLGPAGALADPVLRVELMNINNYGNDAPASLLPSKVGETEYTADAAAARLGQARPEARRGCRRRRAGDARAPAPPGPNWPRASRPPTPSIYRTAGNERLTREVLDLMSRLEQVAQARYAGGLVVQQDAIRAQLEQTAMRSELIALDNEKRQLRARLNGLLARDVAAPLADPQVLRPLPNLATVGCRAARRAGARAQPSTAGRAGAAGERAEEPRPHLEQPLSRLAGGAAVDAGGFAPDHVRPDGRDEHPAATGCRAAAQEREAEAMVGAARSRAEALANQLLGELAGNLAALRRRTTHRGVGRDAIATAVGAEPALGAGRLRERQGRLRHAARRPAADSQGADGPSQSPGRGADAPGRNRTHCGRRPLKTATTLLAVVVLGAVGAGSYWLGTRSPVAGARRCLRRRLGGQRQRPQRKLLYYRNPMGLADTSPTPKKDPMGMDYIAVYEGEDSDASAGTGRGQPDPHQHREDPEAGRAHRSGQHAPARQDGARRGADRARRAARVRDRAQVRGLCRAAATST